MEDHLPKTTEMYVDSDNRMGSSTSILAGRVRHVSTILPRLLSFSSDFARNAQFRVKCRMWLALLARRTGAYVSVATGMSIKVIEKVTSAVMLNIQRHPKEWTMIEPMTGPKMGPIIRNVPVQGMAKPRCFGVQMSARVPLRIADGAAPKTPWRNRQRKTRLSDCKPAAKA